MALIRCDKSPVEASYFNVHDPGCAFNLQKD
jgi:hypothetical protein